MSDNVMAISPIVPVAVIGQDIDRGVIRSLCVGDGRFAGDKVLVEINGKLTFSSQSNPLIAELPWEVTGNDDDSLRLKHPSCTQELVLRWDELLKGPVNEPAVFATNWKYLSSKMLYVVLQFVSYTVKSDVAESTLKPEWDMREWDDLLADPFIRRATLEKLAKDLKFLGFGWNWHSATRFAIRSGVRLRVIDGFRTGDQLKINSQPDEVLLKILRELRWMSAYRRQAEKFGNDNENDESDKSAGKPSNA
jgi:hypothetical protein